ncbi:sulfotransferase, partial [Acinetobacter baumannii]
ESYLELLDMLGDQSARVTDKSPPNLTFAGLLHAAFPNARMICMRRKPIDVAMSVWMTPIASVLGDKRDVVEVIRETNRLADH